MQLTHREWLRSELGPLTKASVIDQQTADRLSAHYQLDTLPPAKRSVSLITIILAAFGGLLIGGGIILIFAHNWENFGRTTRAVLAFLPLVLAQGLALYCLLRKNTSQAWRETVGALLFCAVPASISIIGQTYHLSNDTQSFLSWWFALLVPFVYLLRAHLLACLLLALSVYLMLRYGSPYWLCLIVMAPYYCMVRQDALGLRALQYGWLFACAYAIACPFMLIGRHTTHLTLVSFVTGAALLYLIGALTERASRFRDKPFTNIGAVALSITALTLTYQDVWREQLGLSWANMTSRFEQQVWHESVFEVGLTVAALSLFGIAIRRKLWRAIPISSLAPTVLVLSLLPATLMHPIVAAAIITIVVIGLGIWYVFQGVASDSTSQLNFGLILLMSLLTLRFFDQDLSFIARGIAFIIMGLILIGMNIWHSRRKSA